MDLLSIIWLGLGGFIWWFALNKSVPQIIRSALAEFLAERGYVLTQGVVETLFGLFSLVYIALWIFLGLWIFHLRSGTVLAAGTQENMYQRQNQLLIM